MTSVDTPDLKNVFISKWPAALSVWSKFTKLSEPRWCFTDEDEKHERLAGSFAMIRLDDQAVVISLQGVAKFKLQNYAVEIMAHEIGHHVYCPGDLTDQGRMLARMRKALPTVEDEAAFCANLYADLLINDKLRRSANLEMDAIYKAIGDDGSSAMWTFYMRIYELLWALPSKTLARGTITDAMEGDAQLGARVIRSYSREWLRGAGRFAALCLPYIAKNEHVKMKVIMRNFTDGMHPSSSSANPVGLTEIEEDEAEGAVHPSEDPALSGDSENPADPSQGQSGSPAETKSSKRAGSQHREPFEYGALLKNLGINLTADEVAIRYYKERATPHLVRFPQEERPQTTEPMPEGIEPWDIGSPVENIDWLQTLLTSPTVIPSVTTVQRVYGQSQGSQPKLEPVDLDIYIDSSGSMPDPQVTVSYLALAGAIIALSALRIGAKVQATLWAGARSSTDGFITDEREILRLVTGCLGGGTAFPIDKIKATYESRKKTDRAVHILVISDDGVNTMFRKDEYNNDGWEVARMALENGRGGGTLVLNFLQDWRQINPFVKANKLGFDIHTVTTWEQLEQFAREFSQKKYGVRRN